MPLKADEIDRYARHLVLRDVGGPGQLKLKAARVLVIGAGGLGTPLIQYLAAAGIGGSLFSETTPRSRPTLHSVFHTVFHGFDSRQPAAREVDPDSVLLLHTS